MDIVKANKDRTQEINIFRKLQGVLNSHVPQLKARLPNYKTTIKFALLKFVKSKENVIKRNRKNRKIDSPLKPDCQGN